MMKILYNATIYTLDEARPLASAIALDHDRIVTLGESDDLLSEFDGAEIQDMGGRTILPGLTDAHLHLQQYALSYARQTQLDQGAKLAFGSDAPVETPNPFLGLHAAVTRQRADGSPGPEGWYPEQRLSMQAAVEGYTLGPAYTAGMETRLGKLAPGYLADLIVLTRNPFVIPPSELLELEASETMIAGEWVWQS